MRGLKDFLMSKVKPSSLDITEDDQMNLGNGLLKTDGNSQRRRKNSYEKYKICSCLGKG